MSKPEFVYIIYIASTPEKVFEALFPHGAHEHERAVGAATQTARNVEDEKVNGAIKTDFILSAEIMAITLASIPLGSTWMRAVVLAVVGIGITALVYGGVLEMMSRPKTVRLEWRNLAEATVLAASMREGEAIYVWLEIEGTNEPRAYALPWDMQAAQELQQAMSDAESNGTGVKVSQPFEPTLDTGEPKFYAMPQPALPPKPAAAEGPLVFQQPEGQL